MQVVIIGVIVPSYRTIMENLVLYTRNSLNKNKQSLLYNYRSFKSYLPTDLLIFNVDDVIAVP